MPKTIGQIVNKQKEQMQQDLLNVLDGIDDQKLLDRVCQVIVDRCDIIRLELNHEVNQILNSK